jgi:NAD dependent epimerase/dehydratase family enzyme
MDDLVNVFLFALSNEDLRGAVNAVAPNPARNAEFTRTLAKVLDRPAVFPLPAIVFKTLFGEMGESLLFASARVQPGKLTAAGYNFRHRDLDEALRFTLTRHSMISNPNLSFRL